MLASDVGVACPSGSGTGILAMPAFCPMALDLCQRGGDRERFCVKQTFFVVMAPLLGTRTEALSTPGRVRARNAVTAALQPQ